LLGDGPVSIRGLLLANEVTEVLDWQLVGANAISANNRIVVGFGFNPDGNFEGWIAELPTVIPEPSTVLLVGSGLVVLAVDRRRRMQRISRTIGDGDEGIRAARLPGKHAWATGWSVTEN
jgi:hypothetical protein